MSLITRPNLHLNGETIIFTDYHKYLGIFIQDKKCNLDISRQLRRFHANAKRLLLKLSKCSDDVKTKLFRSYCTNMYCCQFWTNAALKDLNKLKVAYNNSFRRLMELSYRCSASGMFVSNKILSFPELIRKNMWSFIDRLRASENVLINAIVNSSVSTFSPIWGNWYHCLTLKT